MNATLLIVLAILLVSSVTHVYLAYRELCFLRGETSSEYLTRMSRPSVAVHLKGGTSLKGVLYEICDDVIILRHASAAPVGAKDFAPVDGEQAIPRENIDWIQNVGTAEEAS